MLEKPTTRTAVVIPVRNREQLVLRAIRSIQGQTRAVDEIIVVDDASIDGTCLAVEQMAKDDERIRLIRIATHQGASSARNHGIHATACDWLAFLDSDDEWMEHKHETQLAALSDQDAIASFAGTRHQWADHFVDSPLQPTVSLHALRKQNCLGSTSTAIIRRSALLKVGGFDASLLSCQDWDLWLKLRRIGNFAVVCRPLVIYNHDVGPRISRNREAILQGHAQMFPKALVEVDDSRNRREITAYHRIRLAQIHSWEFGEHSLAVRHLVISLATYPTVEAARLLKQTIRASLTHSASRP